jgi:cytochrome c7-like protein
MSQLFHRHTNVYSRLSILAVLLLVGALGATLAVLNWSGYNTNQHVFVEQPLQFSHAHHVGGMGIDCRYCHTSVEESSFANIPPTKICMNCHSQIWNTAPILEPIRASFRDNRRTSCTSITAFT